MLGEILGDPDPTGKITDVLRQAAFLYRDLWRERLDLGQPSNICNDIVAPLGDFHGPTRHGFCTNLAAEVAALACEVLLRTGHQIAIPKHLEAIGKPTPAGGAGSRSR